MGAALNDLAYAVNDTIKDPAKFKALNILMQEMINASVVQALNDTFGTEDMLPLNVLLSNVITNHGFQEFTANGTFVVPEGVNIIFVTACGGGGGGGGSYYKSGSTNIYAAGGGGGGGAAIFKRPFMVAPGDAISITIGAAGSAGASKAAGGNGGATVIGALITLAGGKGGQSQSTGVRAGGAAGGDGGGHGGTGYYSGTIEKAALIGTNGVCGSAGLTFTYGSGGGGGSVGNGGAGGIAAEGSAGSKGGGGGGGDIGDSVQKTGGAGGKGYALIEW